MSRNPKPAAAAAKPVTQSPAKAKAPAALPPVDASQVAPETTGAASAPASAAAEAAAAPVDLDPKVAGAAESQTVGGDPGTVAIEIVGAVQTGGVNVSDDTVLLTVVQPEGADLAPSSPTDKGFILRVKGPAKGRWRAGRHFGPEAVDIPADELSEEDMQKLHGDPELTVLVLGES